MPSVSLEVRKRVDALAPALGFRLKKMEKPAERDWIALTGVGVNTDARLALLGHGIGR